MDMTDKTTRIRELNDSMRKNIYQERAFITRGVAALGPTVVDRIVKTVMTFDTFCHENDPHNQHDFGGFEDDGILIMFKIDYYDKAMEFHSPEPSDPVVTERVITILLGSEY
jgi:hypothetical protein